MKAGKLQQFNTPEIIYKRPANLFVAQFIGNPPSNILEGVIKESEGNYYFEAHGFRLDISSLGDVFNKMKRPDKAALGFRAEDIAVRMSQGNGEYTAGTVYNIELLGYESILDIKLKETIIRALVPQNFEATAGDTAFFKAAVEKVNLFDLETGKNLLF
jgi:ABC-type sugar transport system ATPase subunit